MADLPITPTPLPTAPPNKTLWWITTILGVAVIPTLVYISQNCPFGADVCGIVAIIASAASALMGVTHSGNVHLTPNS